MDGASSVESTTKPKYYVNIVLMMWSCGDGCCSESYYIAEIYEVLENSPLMHHRWITEIGGRDTMMESRIREEVRDWFKSNLNFTDEDFRTRIHYSEEYRDEEDPDDKWDSGDSESPMWDDDGYTP